MRLRHLSDSELHENTKTLVRKEREILTQVLWHLHEVDRRKLFSAMKYKSLHEYAVKELGYAEDQAYRRISAMRLLREVPEIEEKIDSGKITLTAISKAQTFFRRTEKKTRKEKSEILKKLEGKTTREVELTLNLIAPDAAKAPDRIKPVTEELVEIKFQANKALEEKLGRLKGLLAYKYPNISLGELIENLADLGLKEWSPSKEPSRVMRKRGVSNPDTISAQDRRDVWQRANHRCENCGSTYALEIDHIIPRALGGASTRKNLRLLCRNCNQRAAIEKIGIQATNWRAD